MIKDTAKYPIKSVCHYFIFPKEGCYLQMLYNIVQNVIKFLLKDIIYSITDPGNFHVVTQNTNIFYLGLSYTPLQKKFNTLFRNSNDPNFGSATPWGVTVVSRGRSPVFSHRQVSKFS